MIRASAQTDGADAVVLRQSGAVLVPVAVWGVCAGVVVDSLVEGGTPLDQVRTVLVMVSISFVAWMFLASPCLVLVRSGVRVVNLVRVHWIPFEVLDEVQARGLTALVVRDRAGRLRRITSWNAPGVPRAYSASTPPVARAIEQRRRSWEGASRTDPAAALVTTWRWRPLLGLLLVVLVQVTIWWR